MYHPSGVDVIYLNIYSLIKAIENGSTILHRDLGVVTREALGEISTYTFKTRSIGIGDIVAFKQAYLQGKIVGNFVSIPIKNSDDGNMNIVVDGQKISNMEGIALIYIIGFDDGFFEAESMDIFPGRGFYINSTIQNVSLGAKGNQVKLVLSSKNGSIYIIEGKSILFEADKIDILLRRPQIVVNGSGFFTDLYAYKNLYIKLRSLGSDLKVDGWFTFSAIYGDTYTIVKNFGITGNIYLSEPIYIFDEIRTSIELLPYLFIIIIIYIIFHITKWVDL